MGNGIGGATPRTSSPQDVQSAQERGIPSQQEVGPTGVDLLPGGHPVSSPSQMEAQAIAQQTPIFSSPRDVSTAASLTRLPPAAQSQLQALTSTRQEAQAANDGLSDLYAAHSDPATRKALDQVAPDILGRALSTPKVIQELVSKFGLSGQGQQVLEGLLSAQIEKMTQTSDPVNLELSIAELRGTQKLMQQANVLTTESDQLLGEILQAGANKLEKAQALAARAPTQSVSKTAGELPKSLPPVPEAKGDVLARSLGMSALDEVAQKQDKALLIAQKRLAVTTKYLTRLETSEKTLHTLQGRIDALKPEDTASRAQCAAFSQKHQAVLETAIDQLDTKTMKPAEFASALDEIGSQAGRLLTKEDQSAIETRITDAKNAAETQFREAALERHTDLSETERQTLVTLLAAAGFDESVEDALSKAKSDEWKVLAQGMKADANASEQSLARHTLDMLLADDLGLLEDLLALKLNSLTGETNAAQVMREHERTVAYAEVAAMFNRGQPEGQRFSAGRMNTATLDGCLKSLGQLGGRLDDADLMLVSARFKAYVAEHPEAADKKPGEVPEFLKLLPPAYQNNRELLNLLDKGIVGSAQAQTAGKGVETATRALDTDRLRTALAQQSPLFDLHRAQDASLTFARLLTGAESLGSITPDSRQKIIQGKLEKEHPELTTHEVSAKTLDAVDATGQAASATLLEQALMKAQGVKKPAEIHGETLALTLQSLQRLLATDLSDLSAGQLKALGLAANNCTDATTLGDLIKHTDWQSLPMTFERGLLLSTYLQQTMQEAVKTPESLSQELATLMTKLGVPADSQKSVRELAGLSDEARYAAVGQLEVLRFGSEHVQMDRMISGEGHKDDNGGALTLLANRLAGWPGGEPKVGWFGNAEVEARLQLYQADQKTPPDKKALAKEILASMQKDVPGVGDRMAVADAILQRKAHDSNASKAESMKRALSEKVFNKESLAAPGSAVTTVSNTLFNDKFILMNAGRQAEAAQRLAFGDMAKESLGLVSGRGLLAGAKDTTVLALTVQSALMDTFTQWAQTLPESADKSLAAFEQAYRNDLGGHGGFPMQTKLFQGLSGQLQNLGLTASASRALSLEILLGGSIGGLQKLMEGGMALAGHIDAVHHWLTPASHAAPPEVEKFLSTETQRGNALDILNELSAGEGVSLTDKTSAKVKMKVPVTPGVKVSVEVSAGLEDGLKIFADDDGHPCVLLGSKYEAGIGAEASLCGEILTVSAEVDVTAGRGVSLKFASKEDCAAFVAKLVTGQATRADLSVCSGITTLTQVGASVQVGVEVDIGKAIGAEVLQVSAAVTAGAGIGQEISMGPEGRTVTTSKSVALKASLTLGIDKKALQTEIGGRLAPDATEETEETQEEEVEDEDEEDEEDDDILSNPGTAMGVEIDKSKLSATFSGTLGVTVENKVVTDHSGAFVRSAATSYSTQVDSEKGMRFFLSAQCVSKAVQDDIAVYMKTNGLDAVRIACDFVLPKTHLKGHSHDAAMHAANDARLYKLDHLTLSFTSNTQRQSASLDLGVLSLKRETAGEKENSVEFSLQRAGSGG
jgi:hypothetical protein